MKNIMFLFIISIFGVSANAGNMELQNPVAPPAPSSSSEGGSCTESRQKIQDACSRNPTMQSQLDGQGNVAAVSEGQLAGATAEQATLMKNTASVGQSGLNSAKEQCMRAGDTCKASCEQERDQANQKYGQLSTNPATQAQAQQEREKAIRFNRYNDECSQEVEKSVAKMDKGLGDLSQLLAALGQILQALGVGEGNGEVDLAEASVDEEDECAGANASLLLKCSGVSDPVSSRAGVSGATGVGDLSGGSGESLFGQAADGDSSDDSSRAANAAGSGFQNNGLGGGFGLGSAPGSGVSAASSDKEKLDADIYKGYMGGGGGGGFGSFSGGGGSGSGLSFGKSSGSGSNSSAYGRKKLQSALDKAVGGGRNPASMEGTNGPYQNIWGVVSKTYKKTSSSMFHKE